MEISYEEGPSGVCPRTTVTEHLSGDTDNGTECTPSKPAGDTRVSGVLETLWEGDATQRYPDRLQRWHHENLMQLKKTNWEVLQVSGANPTHGYRLGNMMD